jgi:hypothetical protein
VTVVMAVMMVVVAMMPAVPTMMMMTMMVPIMVPKMVTMMIMMAVMPPVHRRRRQFGIFLNSRRGAGIAERERVCALSRGCEREQCANRRKPENFRYLHVWSPWVTGITPASNRSIQASRIAATQFAD